MGGLKARLARAFLNFLDEHGDYRTELEATAARAAAAEANSLFAKDKAGRKKKKKRGKDGSWIYIDDDDELLLPPTQPTEKKGTQLPEDPYEQIQFYYKTFKTHTTSQIHNQLQIYSTNTKNWLHNELHNINHVSSISFVMLCTIGILYGLKLRNKKMMKLIRIHSILGKSFNLKDYIINSLIKGRVLLQLTSDGSTQIQKLAEKAEKAEVAALSAMRPYQRKKYENYVKVMKLWECVVKVLLVAGLCLSGFTFLWGLNGLVRGTSLSTSSLNGVSNGGMGGSANGMGSSVSGDSLGGMNNGGLDGQIYSYNGPTDSDGYPLNMRSVAEENYAKCLLDAEDDGILDPTRVCNVESFFDEPAAAAAQSNDYTIQPVTSPLRTKINYILTNKLHIPTSISNYLTTLQTQTLMYLTALYTFILFLTSHYIAYKIHSATIQNDPMKHFVISATDKSIKADGTVAAKKGETEAQRKKRERMLQNERLKAKMAQLAMEAKQRVQERRERLEGAAAVEKEKEEAQKKVVEEQEEIVKMHGRQYMMVKAGVPDGAILNSFLAEGMDDEEENKGIIEQLKAIKVRRAEEARQAEELEAKKLEDEKKAEEEKELIAKERLRQMKLKGKAGSTKWKKGGSSATGTDESDSKGTVHIGSVKQQGGDGSVTSTSSVTTIGTKSTTASADPSAAKSAMLGQIGGGQGGLKSASLRKVPTKIKTSPAPRPGSSTILSGNLPTGAKSDKRWDRDTKTWVVADEKGDETWADKMAAKSPVKIITPKKSNMSRSVSSTSVKSPPQIKNKGDEMPSAMPSSTNTAAQVDKEADADIPQSIAEVATQDDNQINKKELDDGNASSQSSSPPPIMVPISSSPDCNASNQQQVDIPSSLFDDNNSNSTSSWAQRPSARDIQAAMTELENAPDEEEEEEELVAPPSPAYEMALRTSNSSWDRRPSSKDVMDKIRAVEMLEAKEKEQQKAFANECTPRRVGGRSSPLRSSGMRQQITDPLAIIDESKDAIINSSPSFEFKRKSSKSAAGGDNNASDDEISELSEPTIHSIEHNALLKGRSIPQALFIKQSNNNTSVMSPMLALTPTERKKCLPPLSSEQEGRLKVPPLEEESGAAKLDANEKEEDVAPVVEETEEQKQRRLKAEARAKKMEAITARRNAGEDDDASAVSGISKRHRMRRKKKVQMAATQEEESVDAASASQKSDDKSSAGTPTRIKVETEEDKLRKKRAEARAKKMEALAARRNAGKDMDDDNTAVSGISRRHRIRRKKSALAAITPEERERNEWKKNVYTSVLKSEQVQWQTSIYSHVLTAETTRSKNIEERRELEEQNAAAHRRIENKKRLEKRAKKFAAKADRFHQIRRDGADDDESSVVSSASRMRRRRTRKSIAVKKSIVECPVEESTVTEETSPKKATPIEEPPEESSTAVVPEPETPQIEETSQVAPVEPSPEAPESETPSTEETSSPAEAVPEPEVTSEEKPSAKTMRNRRRKAAKKAKKKAEAK